MARALTKHVDGEDINKHLKGIGRRIGTGRHSEMPEVAGKEGEQQFEDEDWEEEWELNVFREGDGETMDQFHTRCAGEDDDVNLYRLGQLVLSTSMKTIWGSDKVSGGFRGPKDNSGGEGKRLNFWTNQEPEQNGRVAAQRGERPRMSC